MKDPREPLTNSKDSVPKPDANSATNVAQKPLLLAGSVRPMAFAVRSTFILTPRPQTTYSTISPGFFESARRAAKAVSVALSMKAIAVGKN